MPPTAKRVSLHTCPSVNAHIRKKTICDTNHYKDSSDNVITQRIAELDEEWDTERILETSAAANVITQRIAELDEEWDTERILETSAAAMVIAGSAVGFAAQCKHWYLFTGIAGLFLLQHALCGWCPPMPLLRRFGVRTEEEINKEKLILKMMRKDFLQENCSEDNMMFCAEK